MEGLESRFNLLRSIRFIATRSTDGAHTPFRSFNLLRSIRFIATGTAKMLPELSRVSISYGAFGSLRPARAWSTIWGASLFQSPTEHSVHCDPLFNTLSVHIASVSISYGAFGSLRRPESQLTNFSCGVSISYGAFGSLRQGKPGRCRFRYFKFQSPTEHSVHCDVAFYCSRPITRRSFNLLRSIRFIATPSTPGAPHRETPVSISYGAFGSLRR